MNTAMLLLFVAAVQQTPSSEHKNLLHIPADEPVVWLKPTAKPADVASAFVKTEASDDAISDAEIIDQATLNCKFAAPSKVDRDLLWRLLDIEKAYNVPEDLKGMILAAACHESGYNPNALGDRKFSKSGHTPMAVGLFQMWRWWESDRYGYGIDRRDPVQSAEAYMKHVTKHLKTVKRKCKGYNRENKETKRWLAAWATAIRAPKKAGRCGERPRFYRFLKHWQRDVERRRKEIEECRGTKLDGCGC